MAAEPAYIDNRKAWEGSIRTYVQPGSFPVESIARIVEIGHMADTVPIFEVELMRRDMLGKPSWATSVDPDVLRSAFCAYINTLLARV